MKNAFAVLAVLSTGICSHDADATPTFPYPWPDYSVVPVLFSPTDWNISSTEVQQEANAIRHALTNVQQFYGQQLGKTFLLNDLQVIQGVGAKENYGITWNGGNIYADGIAVDDNFEGAVVSELYSRGFPTPPAQNESGYVALIFVKGAGGWAGGRELSDGDGGWAILGDWAIDSIQGQVPEGDYWWSGVNEQTGAVAHELGHTFGLPHPDAYGGDFASTVMGNWWEYPGIGFNQYDLEHLNADKSQFFTQSVVPEPSTTALLLIGTLALPLLIKRKL